jgi:cytidine deaminase
MIMSPKGSIPASLQELFEAAKKARELSYSPYSRHKVGAAIRMSDGSLYTGCNVENSSYGGTICAERVAIQKAVSEGNLKLKEVMVVTDSTPPWPPCGMCRQVIAEFSQDARLHTANLAGECESFEFSAIFPRAFTPAHLLKGST